MKVCVIGAGAAGLAVAKNASADPTVDITVYEQGPTVGGTWVYSEHTGQYKHGLPIHSSMYPGLRTNLPKDSMAFPGHKFPADVPTFPGHKDVLAHIQGYAEAYDLLKFIKFETQVETVRKVWGKWQVESLTLPERLHHVEYFDAVFVCSGHYSKPRIPRFPGETEFKGTIIHTHDFRTPEPFRGLL